MNKTIKLLYKYRGKKIVNGNWNTTFDDLKKHEFMSDCYKKYQTFILKYGIDQK